MLRTIILLEAVENLDTMAAAVLGQHFETRVRLPTEYLFVSASDRKISRPMVDDLQLLSQMQLTREAEH